VARVLATAYDEPFDLVVLDPPREGAKRAVVEQVADRAPRAVAYVACDPAALARDVAFLGEAGYELREVQGYDLFPMTHHVEAVAVLARV
jgi:tRNA/tmRNA/rRNA uracil-C5-methylase (TrmA/RlmC/RlmD family)